MKKELLLLISVLLASLFLIIALESIENNPDNAYTENTTNSKPQDYELPADYLRVNSYAAGVTELCSIEIPTGLVDVYEEVDEFIYEGGRSRISRSGLYGFIQFGCGSQGVVGLISRESLQDEWVLVAESAVLFSCEYMQEFPDFPTFIYDCSKIDFT